MAEIERQASELRVQVIDLRESNVGSTFFFINFPTINQLLIKFSTPGKAEPAQRSASAKGKRSPAGANQQRSGAAGLCAIVAVLAGLFAM